MGGSVLPGRARRNFCWIKDDLSYILYKFVPTDPHLKPSIHGVRERRGRPRKFIEPSKAVTLTLPLSVIEALTAIDADLSRAVVRLAQPEMARRPHEPAELATFGGRAVIVITPSRVLERRTGVGLVPLPDGRALISFDQPITVAALELRLDDALEDAALPAADRAVFQGVARILKEARRSRQVTLRQPNIIVLDGRRRRAGSAVTTAAPPRSRTA